MACAIRPQLKTNVNIAIVNLNTKRIQSKTLKHKQDYRGGVRQLETCGWRPETTGTHPAIRIVQLKHCQRLLDVRK